MVCPRCEYVIKQLLEDLGTTVLAVSLGQVVVKSDNLPSKVKIDASLQEFGFELLKSKKARQVERIKVLLIHLIYYQKYPVNKSLITKYLELATHNSYEELDALFIPACGCTIIEYVNLLKFERAKELISYNEHSIQEISQRLGYSTSEDLSLEFKRKLNLTITEFIYSKDQHRISIDSLI
jgi:AraC-like DNA-binding protein